MPLQSSGAISIADVVTFTRASTSVVKPFSIGPEGTQRALSFYYNQAFIAASTFDVIANEDPNPYITQTNTSNTNGSTIFNAIGNVFSLRLNNSSGYVISGEGTVNSSKGHSYIISNIPAGTYKIGTRYAATAFAPSGQTVSYRLTAGAVDTIVTASSTDSTNDISKIK
jgi:hypothetical protein